MQDPIDFVPERVFLPVKRTARAVRLSHALGDGLASLLLNGVVVACLAFIGWPLQTTSPYPEAISVELVDSIPGEKSATGKKEDQATPAAPPRAVALVGPLPGVEASAVSPDTKASPPQKPEQQLPQEPEPSLPSDATPASLEHPSADPKPRLVAPPPDPQEAVHTSVEESSRPTSSPAPPDPPKPDPPALPPEHPNIVAGADAADPAPPPSTETEAKTAEPTAEEKRQAETTAKLAAALPFGQSVMSDPFRASVAGSGSTSANQYRGAVYGAFRKADSILAEAQAKHLKGQAVIAFSIDDSGVLVHAGVAVSSGNAEIDRMALAIIQQSAPYPPPPHGAQHSFSPAIGFGLEQ